MGPDIEYQVVKDIESGAKYLLAAARVAHYFADEASYEVVATYTGEQLAGHIYTPIFDDFASQAGAFKILSDAFVSTEDGTGIVHMAPAYGEDDYRICRAADIELVDPLDEDCVFTDAVPAYAGQFCKEADKAIIKQLKEQVSSYISPPFSIVIPFVSVPIHP